MADTQVFDWRVWKAGTVAADSRMPDGTPIREGDVFYVTTVTRDHRGQQFSFATPSNVSLALSVSITAAKEAAQLREFLPRDPYKDLSKTKELYAYFEQCMVSVTFAFQSLEAFANHIVDDALQESKTLAIQRRDGAKDWNADEIARNCSTEEKLADILPQLGKIPSPKGKKPWENFKKLKRLRDSTIHMKSPDQYVRGKVDKESLYYRFLNHHPLEYPRSALVMLRHFTAKETDGWLRAAEARLAEPYNAA